MRVLIAEDNLESRLLLQRLLKNWGHEVVVTTDGRDAWQTLRRSDAPELAILDWMMPGMDGVDLCRKVRQESEARLIYLILLTGRNHREDIIQGIESGADDYVSKPFDPQELKVRLRAGQRIVELHQGLLREATHDSLTSTWNRKTVLEILHRELGRVRAVDEFVSVIMADIDHFKHINDTLGHPAGDAVIRNVARLLQGSIRLTDALGRYGGEEFLIVLPGCDFLNNLAIAERIRQVIDDTPIAPELGVGKVTLSVGAATRLDFQMTGEMLIKLADEALYRAKLGGRNRVESASSSSAMAQIVRGDKERGLPEIPSNGHECTRGTR